MIVNKDDTNNGGNWENEGGSLGKELWELDRDLWDLAMESLEIVKTPKEAWDILYSVNTDIDNREVMFHLDFNPILSYTILENYEASSAFDHDEEETTVFGEE
jgi:hypothetical protein